MVSKPLMAPSKASLPSSKEPSFSAFADKKHLSFSNVLKRKVHSIK
jgi:hypothetical protein